MRLWNSGRSSSKRAVLLAAVFALGGGEAAAQLTPDNTLDGNGLKVEVAAQVAEGTSTTIAVTVRASVDANTPSSTPSPSPSASSPNACTARPARTPTSS